MRSQNLEREPSSRHKKIVDSWKALSGEIANAKNADSFKAKLDKSSGIP